MMQRINSILTAYDRLVTKLRGGLWEKFWSLLFYLAWTIELAVVIIDKSALVNPYESYIFRATFLLFAAKMLVTRFSPRERGWLFLALVFTFADYRISGRNDLLRTVVFIAALRDMDIRRVLKFTLWATAAGCLLLVFLSFAGIGGSVSLTQDFGNGIETRYALGLGHPNALHCMAAMLGLLALYSYDSCMKWWSYLAFLLTNGFLYALTKSNTGFLILTGGIVLSMIMHYNIAVRRGRLVYLLGEAVLAGGLLFTLAGAILNPAEHPLLAKIDALMTGRIASVWDTTFHEGTLSSWALMGDRRNTAFFDLGFDRFVTWYGVIPGILLIWLIYACLERMRKRHDAAAFVLLLCCCLYTVPEAHLVSAYLGRNYCLLLVGIYLPLLIGGQDGNGRERS